MSKRRRQIPRLIPLRCDPGLCDNCIYIGEGDFICDRDDIPFLVVDEWEPTDKYLSCKRKENTR